MIEQAKKIDETILERLVVQVYDEKIYRQVMQIYPFQSVILNTVQKNLSEEQIVNCIKETGLKVVTISTEMITESLMKQLEEQNCYVYVDKINEEETLSKMLSKGVYGCYTDYLCDEESQIEVDKIWKQYLAKRQLPYIDEFNQYLEYLTTTDFLILISIKDDAAIGLNDSIQNNLYSCGATKSLQQEVQSGGIFILQKQQSLFEEFSKEKKVIYNNIINDTEIYVESAGIFAENHSIIKINGIDYSMNMRGINLVVYDLEDMQVIDSINIDMYEGAVFSRKELTEIEVQNTSEENINNNYKAFIEYLDSLKSERYITIFSVKDEASSLMTEEIQEILFKLGFQKSLLDADRSSFIGILNGTECIFEEIKAEALIYDEVIDNVRIYIESAGYDVGNHSIIQLDGTEYSKNSRGLNIVVYDKLLGKVIDSICFDLYENYKITN